MEALRTHEPDEQLPPYLTTKHAALDAGLFSCSQQGFNIAMGNLCELRWQVAGWLAGLAANATPWETPALIRQDWVEPGVWEFPPDAEWLTAEPGGQLLSPRPLLHLVNRLRHHPVKSGSWLLIGPAARNEDPESTLPLLRQRSFTMVEFAWLGATANAVVPVLGERMEALWTACEELDLPVALTGGAEAVQGMNLELCIPDSTPVSLVRGIMLPDSLKSAYRLSDQSMAVLATSLERWCLAILNRYGVNAEDWPELG